MVTGMLTAVGLLADIGGEEVSNIFGKAGSSPRSTATNATGMSEGSAFGSGTGVVAAQYIIMQQCSFILGVTP